jgi:hypothetical protein
MAASDQASEPPQIRTCVEGGVHRWPGAGFTELPRWRPDRQLYRRRGVRSGEGGYGAQSPRRDRENQGFPQCLTSTPWVIWTRSANSHTGQRRHGGASQAGQMAASDQATRTSPNPSLRRRGRPQMDSGTRTRPTERAPRRTRRCSSTASVHQRWVPSASPADAQVSGRQLSAAGHCKILGSDCRNRDGSGGTSAGRRTSHTDTSARKLQVEQASENSKQPPRHC